MEDLLKHIVLGLTPRVSDSVVLELPCLNLSLVGMGSKLESRVPTLAVIKAHASYIWS